MRQYIENLTEPEPDKQAREARLPAWAREELARLRRELRALETEVSHSREGSRAFLDPYHTQVPLGDDPKVRYAFEDRDDRWADITFGDSKSGSNLGAYPHTLRVRAGHALAVYPEGANGVRIECLSAWDGERGPRGE